MTFVRLPKLSIILLLACSAIGLALIYLRGQVTSHSVINAVPLVTLTAVKNQSLPLLLSSQGHVVALNQVDIQSQITGTLQDVAFKEGDVVQKGQLLFTLENSTQIAALQRAEAAAAQADAQLTKAERDVKRAISLTSRHYISSADWDALNSTVQQLSAQKRAALQDVKSARVQLGYTRIFAPVTGKTGALQAHPGSLLQPGSSVALVSLKQFDPIGVAFTLPEKNLNAILSAQSQSPVLVSVTNAKGKKVIGALDFIDNSVDTDTGTILLKAHFANPDNLLWPGAFQSVTLAAGTEQVATVAPQAIQNGPNGHFVYQVNQQNKVITKSVVLLRIQDSLAVVKGLANGESVVVEGTDHLRPGMLVTVAKVPGFK